MANELLEYEHKAPAVLWYWEAWSGGTKTFSRFLKGCYMDLLDAQFNSESHSLTIEEIKTVLGSDFGQSWPTLQKKFKETSPGQFMNKRLTFEKLKYSAFSKSRKSNAKGKHKPELMENRNKDVNVISTTGGGTGGEGAKPPTSSAYSFWVRGHLVQQRLSDYFRANFTDWLNQWQMKHDKEKDRPITKRVFDLMDEKYLSQHFKDENHVRNSFGWIYENKVKNNSTEKAITYPKLEKFGK